MTTPFLHMRYEKTDCAVMCMAGGGNVGGASGGGVARCGRYGDFNESFTKR